MKISAIQALGFNSQWRKVIMSCVTTVHYSALVNGKLGRSFNPSRGLRQGDPLFPYLFLGCAESLNALINSADHRGDIRGLVVKRGGTSINHL